MVIPLGTFFDPATNQVSFVGLERRSVFRLRHDFVGVVGENPNQHFRRAGVTGDDGGLAGLPGGECFLPVEE